jgi:hypothetical protein
MGTLKLKTRTQRAKVKVSLNEQYGLELNRHDRKTMTESISAISVAVVRQSAQERLHLLDWEGQIIPVVYHTQRKVILTALPPEAVYAFSPLAMTFDGPDGIRLFLSMHVGNFSTDPAKFSVPGKCWIHGATRKLMLVDSTTGFEKTMDIRKHTAAVFQNNVKVGTEALDTVEGAFLLFDYLVTPYQPPVSKTTATVGRETL